MWVVVLVGLCRDLQRGGLAPSQLVKGSLLVYLSRGVVAAMPEGALAEIRARLGDGMSGVRHFVGGVVKRNGSRAMVNVVHGRCGGIIILLGRAPAPASRRNATKSLRDIIT